MKGFELFQEALMLYNQKSAINDELVFSLLDNLSDWFVESRDDSGWQFYEHFLDKFNKIWQYGRCKDLSPEQSYLYGGIWGGLSMLSYIKEKKESSQKCHTLARKYRTGTTYSFLNSIYKTPGMQNKELAETCNVSTARISQIANEALQEGLISSRTFGKEKSYYIRTMGESVHDIAVRQNLKQYMNNEALNYDTFLFTCTGKEDICQFNLEINNIYEDDSFIMKMVVKSSIKEELVENERKQNLCRPKWSNSVTG